MYGDGFILMSLMVMVMMVSCRDGFILMSLW